MHDHGAVQVAAGRPTNRETFRCLPPGHERAIGDRPPFGQSVVAIARVKEDGDPGGGAVGTLRDFLLRPVCCGCEAGRGIAQQMRYITQGNVVCSLCGNSNGPGDEAGSAVSKLRTAICSTHRRWCCL